MRGKAVSQSVGMNLFGNAGFFGNGFDDPLNAALAVAGIEIRSSSTRLVNFFNIPVLISVE